jgi:signal transduction histidine kinase
LLSLAGLHASVLYKRKDIAEEKRKELLESLMKSIEDAFDEVRNISHNLAPSLLSERGLKGALKNITDRVNQSTKLSMSFDTFGLEENLDNLIENTLFRTIQEIVNNTIKHADASKLFLQITQGNNEITLMAEDNGKGFNFDEIKKHSSYGLSHMKSRIENLNGTMFIDSNQNRGTIISILIPLQ